MLERLGFTALTYGPFRAFFGANLVTNASWFVYNAAFGWLVLQISGSAATVGFAAFISGLPFLLLTLYAGLLTDRFGARPLVAISFALTGGLMFLLGVVALVPDVSLALVIVLAFAAGMTQTLGGPGYIAIVSDLVPTRAVSSGVALTFLGFNLGRITGGSDRRDPRRHLAARIRAHRRGPAAGPALGGVVADQDGAPAAHATVERDRRAARRGGTLRHELADAGRAHPDGLRARPRHRLPVPDAGGRGRVRDRRRGPRAPARRNRNRRALSGLIGETVMRRFGHGKTVFIGLATAAAAMVTFGLAPVPGIAIASMAFVGGGFLLYGAASLSLVQALSPPRLRGRLTSVFTLLYWGLMPVGGLLGGILAEATSAQFTMFVAGVGIAGISVIAMIARRQILSLRIGRDGVSADLVPEAVDQAGLAAWWVGRSGSGGGLGGRELSGWGGGGG